MNSDHRQEKGNLESKRSQLQTHCERLEHSWADGQDSAEEAEKGRRTGRDNQKPFSSARGRERSHSSSRREIENWRECQFSCAKIFLRAFCLGELDAICPEARKDLNGSVFDWGERMGIFMNRTEGHRSDITAL